MRKELVRLFDDSVDVMPYHGRFYNKVVEVVTAKEAKELLNGADFEVGHAFLDPKTCKGIGVTFLVNDGRVLYVYYKWEAEKRGL